MRTNSNRFSFVIADDDAEDQKLIQEAIRSVDPKLEYTAVFNGTQLLDLLLKRGVYKYNGENRPDAVILDLNMPVMDGLSALRQLRSQPGLADIPVFILYTSRSDDYAKQCMELNVAGVYVKPNTADELREVIREICQFCAGESQAMLRREE
jgi:two-component system, response regulator